MSTTGRGMALAQLVPLHNGHVHVTSTAVTREARVLPSQEQPEQWSVRDGRDELVANRIGTRAEAIRALGALAMRGAPLPLRVHGPDGSFSGEHLA